MEVWSHKFKFCISIVLYLVISSSTCLASKLIFNDQTFVEEECFDVHHLLNHAKVIEDKVYIQPDSIYFSSNQIYVRIAEDLIPIRQMSCDGYGVFTSIQDIQAGRGAQETWICPKEECGYENYVGIDYCGLCGTYRYARRK